MLLNKVTINNKLLHVIILETYNDTSSTIVFDTTSKFVSLVNLQNSELSQLEKVRNLNQKEEEFVHEILSKKTILDKSLKDIFECIFRNDEDDPLLCTDMEHLLTNDAYKNLFKLISSDLIIISETVSVKINDNIIKLSKNDLSNFSKILNTPELTNELFISMCNNAFINQTINETKNEKKACTHNSDSKINLQSHIENLIENLNSSGISPNNIKIIPINLNKIISSDLFS